MKKSEKQVKEQIKRWLDKHECFHCVYNPWLGKAGMPDRYLQIRGYPPIWLEAKREGKDPTPIQRQVHMDLRRAGCVVGIVRSKEDVIELLDFHNIKLFKKGEENNGTK